jgi:ADP-heptose:LPS heptosyltransferase
VAVIHPRHGGARIVALRALGLGDLLTAVPALRALRDAFPSAAIGVALPEPLVPLLPLVGAFGAIPARPLAPLTAPEPVDVAVNLHGCGPQSHRVLEALHPGRLVAFAHREVPRSTGGPEWREDEHEVQRWCRLLVESGIPADPDRLDLSVTVPAAPDAPTVLHAGAAAPARRWPPDRFAALAAAEAARGHRVLLTGDTADRPRARAIAAAAGLPGECILAGRTTVRGLVDVIAGAGLVVSNDTGVAHLATALRRPSVVLFGPTPPSRWGPPPDRPWHRALWAGRHGDPHGTTLDPGLDAITVDEVDDAIAAVRRAVADASSAERPLVSR